MQLIKIMTTKNIEDTWIAYYWKIQIQFHFSISCSYFCFFTSWCFLTSLSCSNFQHCQRQSYLLRLAPFWRWRRQERKNFATPNPHSLLRLTETAKDFPIAPTPQQPPNVNESIFHWMFANKTNNKRCHASSLVPSLLSHNKRTAIAVSSSSNKWSITINFINPMKLLGTILRPQAWWMSQESLLLLALRPKTCCPLIFISIFVLLEFCLV